jgi:8-oxo-dGTP pyrophosphatase MutT (NUDIX family)/phosphohistidine phosphatase SixA
VAGRVEAQTDGVDALSGGRPIRAAGGVLCVDGTALDGSVGPGSGGNGSGERGSGGHGSGGHASGGLGSGGHTSGGLKVALVHRPRHDDWTLPKGKLHRREHPVTAACREVLEETGVPARIGARLPTVSYQVPVNGRWADKVVDYWAMRIWSGSLAGFEAGAGPGFVSSAGSGFVSGAGAGAGPVSIPAFVAGAETDALAWLDLDAALDRVTYPRDVTVLTAFAELPPVRDPVVLVRHALAGDPHAWTGPDTERPLDTHGLARARALAAPLGCFGPVRLISAAPLRCTQTLAPLAELLRRPIAVDHHFDETADPAAAARRLTTLSAEPGPTVICSQGKLIAPLLAALTGGSRSDYVTAKGGAWVLSFTDTNKLILDPLPT